MLIIYSIPPVARVHQPYLSQLSPSLKRYANGLSTSLYCTAYCALVEPPKFPKTSKLSLRSPQVVHNYITLGYSVTETMPRN